MKLVWAPPSFVSKLLFMLVPVALTACTEPPPAGESESSAASKVTVDTALITEVVKTNAAMAHAVYADTVLTAKALETAIDQLIATPSADTFSAARAAWLAAREPYGKSEVFRFRGGPIDALREDGTVGNDGDGPEGRINAWPLGEALIDYVVAPVDGLAGPEIGNSTQAIQGSIIADTASFPEITMEVLKANQELGGDERNVTSGYHAIEFLLWGQDLNSDGSGTGPRDTSPGQRPWTDYTTQPDQCTSGREPAPELICKRRAEYLKATIQLLRKDLTAVATAWDPQNPNSYYSVYIERGPAALAGILQSMGRLSFGELAGERMNIALLDDSQEDEHSCFSDNTHRDIYLNFAGIVDSFEGNYTRVDGTVVSGPGIDDLLIAAGHAELEKRLRDALTTTGQKIQQIDTTAREGTPFDQQIQMDNHRANIASAITALAEQTKVIEDVARTLQVEVDDLRQDTEQRIQ